MPVPSAMSDLSITAASNSPAATDTISTTDDYLRSLSAIVRTTNAKGTDIPSATTTDIGAATGEFIDVTGTTTITGLGTVAAGITRTVRFTGALTLTHNATSLILPGGANITTANGDIAIFRSLASGNWVCVSYLTAAGRLAIASGKTLTVSNTMTLAGTDSTTMTFPTTSATMARTDAANTFTGVQTMTSPVFTTPVLGTPSSGNLASCTGYLGTSALVTVGALNSGSITSGFGAIDIGTDSLGCGAITSSGDISTASGAVYLNASTIRMTLNKDGADSIGSGPLFEIANADNSKRWLQQLSTSGDIWFHHYNGSTWSVPLKVGATGLAVTGTVSSTSYIEGAEQTAPAAPAANGYRIFAEDNGAGKTRLMVQFATGAAQQIAIEP